MTCAPGVPAGQGKPQPKPYQRVAGGMPQSNAQAATRRSLPGHRTQPDQIGPCRLQLKMQPQRHLALKSDPH
jgi:hypothetical protein